MKDKIEICKPSKLFQWRGRGAFVEMSGNCCIIMTFNVIVNQYVCLESSAIMYLGSRVGLMSITCFYTFNTCMTMLRVRPSHFVYRHNINGPLDIT